MHYVVNGVGSREVRMCCRCCRKGCPCILYSSAAYALRVDSSHVGRRAFAGITSCCVVQVLTCCVLTSLPSAHRGKKTVSEVVLSVDVALDVVPLKLIVTSSGAAHAVALVAHAFTTLVALVQSVEELRNKEGGTN